MLLPKFLVSPKVGLRRIPPRLCIPLVTLLLAFPSGVAAREAAEYVSIVEIVATSETGGGITAAQRGAFEAALLSAYDVNSLDQLSGRVAVFLLTDIRLQNPSLNCYQFGCEELAQDSAASAIKVALAVYVFHLVENRKLDFDQPVGGSTLMDQVVSMIGESDNQAANSILRLVGMENTNAYFEGLRFTKEELHFGRTFSSQGQAVANSNRDNVATPKALAKLYFMIAQESNIDGLLSGEQLRVLRRLLDSEGLRNDDPHYNDRLNGLFPKGVHFYHKTGANQEVIVDAGYVVASKDVRFILVAYDTKKDRSAMARLGLGILKLMKGGRL